MPTVRILAKGPWGEIHVAMSRRAAALIQCATA